MKFSIKFVQKRLLNLSGRILPFWRVSMLQAYVTGYVSLPSTTGRANGVLNQNQATVILTNCLHGSRRDRLVCAVATAGLQWFTAFIKCTVSASNLCWIFRQFWAITAAWQRTSVVSLYQLQLSSFVCSFNFCLSKFSCKSKKILSVGPRHPVPLGTLRQLPHVVTPLQLAEESQRFTGLIKQNFTNINFQVFLQLYEVISNMLRLWSPYIGNWSMKGTTKNNVLLKYLLLLDTYHIFSIYRNYNYLSTGGFLDFVLDYSYPRLFVLFVP